MASLASQMTAHWPWILLLALGALAVRDRFFSGDNILTNFPVIGHLRYWLIEIGPELRQYIVANNREEQPFNREEREWIYRSARGENNLFGFGTDDQVYGVGYPIIKHAVFPWNGSESEISYLPTNVQSWVDVRHIFANSFLTCVSVTFSRVVVDIKFLPEGAYVGTKVDIGTELMTLPVFCTAKRFEDVISDWEVWYHVVDVRGL